MDIRTTFNVDAPADQTYEALVDLERVGPCIPGATVGPAGEDGVHPAEIAVRLGPMRMTYKGTVKLIEQDAEARRAVLSADVREARGQGSARATMTMEAHADGDGATRVEAVTDVQMTGRAAQMGRGIIEDVAARLVQDMASCVSAQLASAPAAGTSPAAPAESAAATRAASTTEAASATGGTPVGDGEEATTPPASAAAAAAAAQADGPTQPASRPTPPAQPARPVGGLRLLLRVLWDRVRRLFSSRSS